MRRQPKGWWTRDRIGLSGAVESVQRIELAEPLVPPTEAGARELGRLYMSEVERSTRGIVRARDHEGGTDLLLAGRVLLLRFAPPCPVVGEGHVSCEYGIRGGVLAARAGGALAVEQRGGSPPELGLALTGYHPRLASFGRPAYRSLQSPIHRAISRRFLTRAARRRRA